MTYRHVENAEMLFFNKDWILPADVRYVLFASQAKYDPSLECVGFVEVSYSVHVPMFPVFKIRFNSSRK